MNSHTAARMRGLRLGAITLGTIAAAAAAVATAPAAGEPAGHAVTAAVAKQDQQVRYRERIAVRGSVSPAASGRPVTLQYAPRGGAYRTVNQTATNPDGSYAVSLRPRQSGTVRAVVDGAASAPRRVAVRAALRGQARRHVKRGGTAAVSGALRPGTSGRTVLVQVSSGRGWQTADRARTRRGGRFTARWRPVAAGSYRVRVVFRGDRRNAAGARGLGGRLNVYRPAHASWYGPGLYGNRTACGQTLGYGTLGVAHKHLPCGTRVTFRHRGRTVTVPVIDRGPFAAGREWDLTAATRGKLRFGSTGVVYATR